MAPIFKIKFSLFFLYRQLHIAIIHGLSQNIILELITLSPHPWFLDIQNDIAQSPLHLAVLTGQPQIARLLLVSGAEVSNFFLLLSKITYIEIVNYY